MASLDFPDDLYVRTEFTETLERPTLRSRKELGWIHTRSQFTSTRRTFKLTITCLSQDDVDTLVEFFESAGYGGEAFNFLHPTTGAEYECVLADDKLEFKYVRNEVWSSTFTIMER